MSTYPYNTVLASTTAYTVLCRAVSRGNRSDDLRVTIKGISGLHAILTTCGAVYLLKFGQWPVDVSGGRSISPLARDGKSSHRLDDTKNPIIAGHNVLANMLTAWVSLVNHDSWPERTCDHGCYRWVMRPTVCIHMAK